MAAGEPDTLEEVSLARTRGRGTKQVAKEVLTKTLKEAVRVKRLAGYRFRKAQVGTLTFSSGGADSRTFVIGKKLGEGGYSTIWKAYELQPDGGHRMFAVKRIVVDPSDLEQVDLVNGEVDAMEALPPHPNVLALTGSCRRPRRRGAGAGGDEVFLLLELCRGGSLATLLQRRSEVGHNLSLAEAVRIFLDMTHSVAHMHAQSPPLAHRDVRACPDAHLALPRPTLQPHPAAPPCSPTLQPHPTRGSAQGA